MAKKSTKQTTPEQAMDELVELSQDLGLYDITDNPLVKDDTTMPVEASTEALESIAGETNATVAKDPIDASSLATESLNTTEQLGELLDKVTEENKHEELTPTVNDKLTLKDGWGNPIPTTLLTVQTVNYTELVTQVLYAAYLGAELDRTHRIMTTVPYRLRLLLPTENYDKWVSKEDVIGYDESVIYNKVLVRAYNLYDFWKNVINIGKNGAIVVPRQVATKVGGYRVPVYTRAPIADTPESRVAFKKVKYTRDELEGFNLESLKIVGNWYDIPSSNSKLKYIKAILERQGC